MHTSTDFVPHGERTAFLDRQKLLFQQLSIAASKYNKRDSSSLDVEKEVDEDGTRSVNKSTRRQKRETKRFCGKDSIFKESIFKRPHDPAPRTASNCIPDHRKNPHKWTRYSLGDVSNEDMTESSNTQAAMSFLRELKARKKKEEADQCQDGTDVESCESKREETELRSKGHASEAQIIFKKPQIAQTTDNSQAIAVEPNDTPVFRSSKIILPEYHVGQRPKKICKQNRPVVKVDRSKELRLEHLQQLDEEDE